MNKTKDLGTYFLRVDFEDGRGYIQEYSTGYRYTDGSGNESPMNATRIAPTWESEDDLISTIQYQYSDGNYSCDCNKSLFLARSQQEEDPETECGDTMLIKRLTLIRPDTTEVVIFPESERESRIPTLNLR